MKAKEAVLYQYYILCNKSRPRFQVVGQDISTGCILGKVDNGQISATIKIPHDCEIEEEGK